MRKILVLFALVAATMTASLAGTASAVVHPMSPPCCDGGGSAVCTTPNRGWSKTWAINQVYSDVAPYSYPGFIYQYNGGLDIYYDPNVNAFSFTMYPIAPRCRVLYAVNPPRAAWFSS